MLHSVTWRNVMWQKIEENLFPMIFHCWKWQICILSLRLFHHAVLGCEGYLFTTKLHTFRNYGTFMIPLETFYVLKRNRLSCFIIKFYQVDLKCFITSTSFLQRPFPKLAKIDIVAIGLVLSSWEERVRFSKLIASYFSHSFSGMWLFIRFIIVEPYWPFTSLVIHKPVSSAEGKRKEKQRKLAAMTDEERKEF